MTNAELIAALRECEYCNVCSIAVDGNCQFGGRDALEVAAADALEAAEQRIAELEAQLPKEGEWIEDDTTYCGADRANYKCSLCGKIGGTWKRGLTQDELPNYCPSCGARCK